MSRRTFTTPRALKKRSKFAARILAAHYPDQRREVFLAGRGENYHGVLVRCRHSRRADPDAHCRCYANWHPLKGTPMTGGMSGYEQPEWDEETLLETLCGLVIWTERPATISDREWARVLRITRVVPFSRERFEADMAAWDREDAA